MNAAVEAPPITEHEAEQVARAKKSYTGQVLARVLGLNGNAGGNGGNERRK